MSTLMDIQADSERELDELLMALRMLHAFTDGPDTHSHLCDPESGGCGHIFEHDRPRGVTDAEYDRLHLCPKCHKGPWKLREF